MGLIQAAVGAIGGTLADQWKEYFYCPAIDPQYLLVEGQKKTNGRSSNTKGQENIISNGSIIAVADGRIAEALILEIQRRKEVCHRLFVRLVQLRQHIGRGEELSGAGMSQEAADALRYEYLRQTGQLPPTDNGGGGYSGGYHSSSKKLKLSDVEKAMDGVKHSNQQKELFETYRQAISSGKAGFSLQELNQLFRDHHWHS